MTENFKDLQFRGTRWYLAEDVDQKLAEYKSKADAWDGWMESGKQTLDMLADQVNAIRNYLNTLENTGGFIDKQKIMKILEAEG